MLKSLNYTVIKCTDCNETIRIQPSVMFESITHECKKAPVKDTATPKPITKAPVKAKATAPKKA